MPGETRTRKMYEQKQLLRNYYAKHKCTHTTLARLAACQFKLLKAQLRMTISHVLNGSLTVPAKPSFKSAHTITCLKLESAVVAWICRCEELSLPVVNGATVKAKAAKLRAKIVARSDGDSAHTLCSMKFSSGWLSRLQHRHDLSSKRLHGKAASVSQAAVNTSRKDLQLATRDYDKRDISNIDESAFSSALLRSRLSQATALQGKSARRA